MPGDDALQRLGERVQTCLVRKGELHLHDIGIALGGGDMMVKNALLQRRQRVDVLDVRGTSRYRVHQQVDSRLIELHQRQHFGGDSLATLLDAIGWQCRCAALAVLIIALFDELDQRRFMLTQMFQQAVLGQGTAIALHHQLTVLDRQVDFVSFECRQEFVDAHRVISMFSVMAA